MCVRTSVRMYVRALICAFCGGVIGEKILDSTADVFVFIHAIVNLGNSEYIALRPAVD